MTTPANTYWVKQNSVDLTNNIFILLGSKNKNGVFSSRLDDYK